MHRVPIKILFFTVFFAICSVSTAANPPPAPEYIQSQYKVLEWEHLIPEGWEPPMIAQAHDEAGKTGADKSSLVSDLDQKNVTLAGFIKPIIYNQNTVSEFLLVPYLPHHIKQHAHLDANQMVYVSLTQPLEVDKPFNPVWVIGTMTLESVSTDEGPTGYRISNAITTEYKY